jgi:SAM-dependent methyltransferase
MSGANPFTADRTAQRYHHGRPYHHERTLRVIVDALDVRPGVAVDVASGTGLSTRALAALGFSPVGVESVEAMTRIARQSTNLRFVVCVAEALPLADHTATLVTVSSAIHWIDPDEFFREARRILKSQGIVAAYDHAGVHLPDEPQFMEWVRTAYLLQYPTPPRGAMAGRVIDPSGFERCFSDHWLDTVTLDHDGLVAYLMTQSNVVDAIETGRDTEGAVQGWLRGETARFFEAAPARDFAFHAIAEAFRAV